MSEKPEFWCLWFYAASEWLAIGDGKVIGRGGSVGQATGDAMDYFGVSEAQMDCYEHTPDAYHYIRADTEDAA